MWTVPQKCWRVKLRSSTPVSYLLTEAGVKRGYSKKFGAAAENAAPGKVPDVTALFVALLVFVTVISCVALGVFGAYFAVAGLLAAFNPSRPSSVLTPSLMPRQSHASGD